MPIDLTVERISPELALVDERLGSAARLALPDVPYVPAAVRAARASEPGGRQVRHIGPMAVLPLVLLALAFGLSYLPLSSGHSGAAVAEAASTTSAPRKAAATSTPRKAATANAVSAPQKTPTVASAQPKAATAQHSRKAATVPSAAVKTPTASAPEKPTTATSAPQKTATASAPPKATTVTSAPRSVGAKVVRWKAVPGADYYNVIFRRNGKRALDLWPTTASASVATGALQPGEYEWYVYPGFRSGGTRRYGPIAASGRLTI